MEISFDHFIGIFVYILGGYRGINPKHPNLITSALLDYINIYIHKQQSVGVETQVKSHANKLSKHNSSKVKNKNKGKSDNMKTCWI
jgi:hypothetical protein